MSRPKFLYLGPSNFILKMVVSNVFEPHMSKDTSIVGAHNQSAILTNRLSPFLMKGYSKNIMIIMIIKEDSHSPY